MGIHPMNLCVQRGKASCQNVACHLLFAASLGPKHLLVVLSYFCVGRFQSLFGNPVWNFSFFDSLFREFCVCVFELLLLLLLLLLLVVMVVVALLSFVCRRCCLLL